MPLFSFVVKERDGRLTRGDVEAESVEHARKLLRGVSDSGAPDDILILDLKPRRMDQATALLTPVRTRDITMFTRQFGMLISAGVTLVPALELLSHQTASPRLAKALASIVEQVKQGMPLSEAMARFPRFFPRFFTSLIDAGFVSGQLDAILERLTAYYERRQALQNNIRTAMMYPVFVLLAAGTIIALLMVFIVPRFVQLFIELEVDLPRATLILIAVSNFLSSYFWLVIIGAIALFLGYGAFRSSRAGHRFLDPLYTRMPLAGAFIRKTVVSNFARTFSTLISSGVGQVPSLEVSEESTDNEVFKEELRLARRKVSEGNELANAFLGSKILNPLIIKMISVGHESAKLDEIFEKIADFYDEEVRMGIDTLVAFLQPVMILLIGAGVAAVLLALYFPIFSLMDKF